MSEYDTTVSGLLDIIKNNTAVMRKTQRINTAFKTLSLLTVLGFLGLSIYSNWQTLVSRNDPHVAMVRISGEIAPDSPTNADSVIDSLRTAFAQAQSKAVMLEINSPGGTPVQAGQIFDEVLRLKTKYPDKKVVSVINDLGASGGYYVAVAGDEIYANRASMVGSIGVRMDSFGFTGIMQKLGVERRLYTAGKFKGFADMFSEPEPEAVDQIKTLLSHVHDQFIAVVKTHRGQRLKDDPNLFSGMVWSGEDALALGLIDGMGDRRSVAEQTLKLEKIVDYTQQEDLLTRWGRARASLSALVSALTSLGALLGSATLS
ncbi:S49 family peptidase [Methylomonas sp. UP202]|uniref:S49 family peptidase n=1 Tax=Methylomonas sp. UP202 TaxID=3040943 RepID=UPI0024789314|nr:S49 family peptidase [Methylomonas sp. UP202]WGS88666.1 S49 family peptidase [Methylomonas sp. UP202]